jgi:Lrp/AsnC family leucine-responsive transcriptional regulator
VLADDPAVGDPTDREIVRSLQKNARLTWQELGRIVHLSPQATAERVRRLEQRGVIAGYAAQVDLAKLGHVVDAVVGVVAQPGADRVELERWFVEQPGIVEAVHLTGPDDYLLRIRCRTPLELDEVLMRMKADTGAASTQTRIVLRALPVANGGAQ